MTNYSYPELFAEHDSVHFVIVNSGATVTGVSNSAPTITNSEYLITEDEMKQESFELTESLCSLDNLKFGQGEPSHTKFTIYNSSDIPNLTDEEITVYIYFNSNSSTLFRVGTYIIDSDKYSADRAFRDISGFDILNMLWDYDITSWYNKFFQQNGSSSISAIRSSLFNWLGDSARKDLVDYTVQQETTTLVNDSYVIEKGIESDKITFGSFMQRIIELNGVFIHVGRDGIIHYKRVAWYDSQPVKVFTEEDIFPPVKYEDYNVYGIAFVDVWDKYNNRLFHEGSTSRKRPSSYSIVDSFVFSNNERRQNWQSNTKTALQQMREYVTHINYCPVEMTTIGNLCYEVGDFFNYNWTTYDDDDVPTQHSLRSYMFERKFKGIQGFKDTISSHGEKRQPKYVVTNDNWHPGENNTGNATDGSGTGGVADVVDTRWDDFIEYIRNVGIRLLDEPSNVEVVYNKEDAQVELKWTDPADITTKRPEKAEWLGTVVIRKENSAPKHRWDGELIVNSTTRDEYSEEPLIDNTIQPNKRYYYGIFPYHRHLSDADNNVNYYRFTKVVSVNTESFIVAPTITSLLANGNVVTMNYTIPTLDVGTYTECIVVYKKGNIPTSKTDGTSVTLNSTETTKVITGLEIDSTYYFIIYTTDSNGNTAESEVESVVTSATQLFTYTGDIQTFVAPKTGIYSLETWGAQGEYASDGTDTARGGFGAYAYGEVLLYEGDTVYVNVGGQNGYGGGGNYTPPNND